jgi:hypothetical protein
MKTKSIENIKKRIRGKIEKLTETELETLESQIDQIEINHAKIEDILSFKGFLKDMDDEFKAELTTDLPRKRLEGSK